MGITKDAYQELEDIVGPENISRDPAVLVGYQYQWNAAQQWPRSYSPRPAAVILPGSTEDVQAIMKVSNRRGIKSRAFGTGHTTLYTKVENEDVIIQDLRRMNRILEFDEKNMYIVVEPYVSFAQVQAEAMKRGLNCHVISAGAGTSFLASHTSAHGHATQSISNGYSGRNLLGVEWVLPTGEVLRLGSHCSGGGWFSGDGPGPSLRGIMRGSGGAYGGLGVFTKCACHLHPWSGPKEMKIDGISPEYETKIPPLFKYHILDFPSWDMMGEAVHKISKAQIAYVLHKAGGPGDHGAFVTISNNEYYEKRLSGELDLPYMTLAVILAANSTEGHAYQIKVLNEILVETGGRIAPVGEEPTWQKRNFLNSLKVCFIPRGPGRTGILGKTMESMDSQDHVTHIFKNDEALIEKYIKKGVVFGDGTINNWMVTYEDGHYSHYEGGIYWDAVTPDDESVKGIRELSMEAKEVGRKMPNSISCFSPPNLAKDIGPCIYNYHNWMKKIKKVFDPNDVSDNTYYISADEK